MENRIDRRKKYILVLDVETAGNIGSPLVYDLGFAICDKKGVSDWYKGFSVGKEKVVWCHLS